MAVTQDSQPLNSKDIEQLHEIGTALSRERDLSSLLEKILKKSRQILSADAASIYLAIGGAPESPTHLRFAHAQNHSVPISNFKEFTIPIDSSSLAGVVAQTGEALRVDDVYKIPPEMPFSFNPEFDEASGYRSKSLLCVPMKDHQDTLIGVVQLWNRKKSRKIKLTPQNIDQEVVPFTEGCHRLLASVSAQAAVAIENAKLYDNIRNLFEGFIRASVTAIESRDPTTSGHSERVAEMTVGLAKVVDREATGVYANERFSPEDLKEIHYAALLHDFGKIGVRESVLVKAKKLFTHELENIQDRFDLLRCTLELDFERKKTDHLLRGMPFNDKTFLTLEKDFLTKIQKLESLRNIVLQSNEPTILPEEIKDDLHLLYNLNFTRPDGSKDSVLTDEQIKRLSIPKGTLSSEERLAIESHVSHTYSFLSKIPWTRDLKRVPEIAFAHHEKLDGSGYPRGLSRDQIPLSSKIMTVADIYDALTARDRPYKKAVPTDKAFDILKMEVKAGKLEAELVRLFIHARVHEQTLLKS